MEKEKGERQKEEEGKRKRKAQSNKSMHQSYSKLAFKALSSQKAFLEEGQLMDLYYLWLSGFQIDTINIQTLNSAGSSRH
jgi:hypothetical protein